MGEYSNEILGERAKAKEVNVEAAREGRGKSDGEVPRVDSADVLWGRRCRNQL